MDVYEASIKVPSMDAVAKEQYLAHKADYVIPEVVDVQHVLIAEKNRTDADAKALAEKVRAEAIANPDSFSQLVEKYSDDPSKISNGGQIRGATSSKMVKEFAVGAQGLTKVGEISPLVKTTYGYHVLKLIRRTPSSQQDFAAVKDELVAKLKESYIAEQRKAFLAKLDQGAPSVSPQGMEALQQHYKLGSLPKIGEAAHASDPESK
jgi:peptidyl-prolyl cis-trans isomerase C